MSPTLTEKRKFQVTTWLDTETLNGPDPKYGIKTRKGKGEWMHCGKDRKLVLFDTYGEAKNHIKELRVRFKDT